MRRKKKEQQPAKKTPRSLPRTPFFTQSTVVNFVSNVLGVIVGIVLTFGVSYLIQRHNEKKQTREIMVLLRKELADNKNYMDNANRNFERTFNACGILLSPEWKTMPKDTLIQQIYYIRRMNLLPMRSSAWNVFQNSDAIKTFDNKELIVILSDYYRSMDVVQNLWDTFNERKGKASNIYVPFANDPHAYVDALLKDESSRRFLESVYIYEYYDCPKMFARMMSAIDYTLYLIDRSGNYQYEFKDVYEDMDTFINEQMKENKTE